MQTTIAIKRRKQSCRPITYKLYMKTDVHSNILHMQNLDITYANNII